MHKGRVYELEPRYRVFAANNNYPVNWPPAKILVTTATWAGTAAASAPAAPFHLEPTGVTSDLHARYEHTLWDNGGGDHAILAIEWSVDNLTLLKMRIMGDWGVNGDLPDNANYYFPNLVELQQLHQRHQHATRGLPETDAADLGSKPLLTPKLLRYTRRLGKRTRDLSISRPPLP